MQPKLSLVYSTGNGNGPFGLGWSLSVPGIQRKTSKGVPRYDGARDVFVLSGAEDLVPTSSEGARTSYRPRTEGRFVRIGHHRDADYWQVRSKDGLVSVYGTEQVEEEDPTTIAAPSQPRKTFAWKLSETRDPFGNRIVYEYERDRGEDGPHHWDQLYLKKIRYVDHEEGEEGFLVSVTFEYEERPDPFSDYRAGFEIRTRKRCRRIVVRTHAGAERRVRSYELIYLDHRIAAGELPEESAPLNGVSFLSQVRVVGHDGDETEELPPLELGYTRFEPRRRELLPFDGKDLPASSLASPDLELVDLFGNGLPDILQLNGSVRYWRNLGDGRYDLPREMADAPAGIGLADAGVQLLDADGDGRADLLVSGRGVTGYFPLTFQGTWDRRSFRRQRLAPSFDLRDPEVRLVDLDGDGVTDAIRSGSRFEIFFNDPEHGWGETRRVERRALDHFPDVNFSDPRVRWADMSGDGLQDVVLVHDGSVEYWPSLGHGDWAPRIRMRNSPRFPYGYDPRRILIGDVDGDGLADLIYVDHGKVLLWINQSGNGWSEPIEIDGTPPVTDLDTVRLEDMLGTGVRGVLWSSDATGSSQVPMYFLDLAGGHKPYLLDRVNNYLGAVTRVEYASSTRFYLEDQQNLDSRWQTPLPFPVRVVARVEVVDELSGGKLTTEYRYHHGHWDGAEREFHGFGRVDQLDTETFDRYSSAGLHGDGAAFVSVSEAHFSPPTLTRTWFHQGPVGEESGDWYEADYSGEFWSGDPQLLVRSPTTEQLLKTLPRRAKRDALRALRGSVLRTELYALDGSELKDRPYTVTEAVYGVREETPLEAGKERQRIFFPHPLAQRTTQWERGDEPMIQLTFTDEYDEYGQPRSQTSIAVPRWRRLDLEPKSSLPSDALPADTTAAVREHAISLEKYLVTHAVTDYARRDDAELYVVDRVARTTTFEIETTGKEGLNALRDGIVERTAAGKIIGQALTYYDGEAFAGLPFGLIGDHGVPVRTEALVLTEEILAAAYPEGRPPYFDPEDPTWPSEYPAAFHEALPAGAGYVFHQGDGEQARGYFAAAERVRYDFHDGPGGRGLTTALRDPLGDADGVRDTVIEYDAFDWLPIRVTDPAGLTTEASYDYRVLQPEKAVDVNGNETTFDFSPLGLLQATWVRGKPGREEGDRQRPSSRLEYDFSAFLNSPPEDRQPVFVRTIRHIHHDTATDVLPAERDETIETVEYSDGFGRLLQTRTQAEDVLFGDPVFGGGLVPADQDDVQGTRADVTAVRASPSMPHVVVSGWQTYDNKGRVVEQYEPFFGRGWDYLSRAEAVAAGDELFGRKVTAFFDPRGQAVRTVAPDASEARVVFGIPRDLTNPEDFVPTPWEAYSYDANDNAGRTHATEAVGYDHHWNTPASLENDALGRPVRSVARHREGRPEPGTPLPAVEEHVTLSSYDVRGNLIDVVDAVERRAFRNVYDLANRPLRVESIDAGTRRTALDAAGNPVEHRDAKGALGLRAHDALNRPIRYWARDGSGSDITLREHVVYGDAAAAGFPDEEAAQRNLLGKPFRHYDEAGRLELAAYDFKGNLVERTRRVFADGVLLEALVSPPADGSLNGFVADWQPSANTSLDRYSEDLLDGTDYTTSLVHDALNRVLRMRYPSDVEGRRRELIPRYNRAGALEGVALDGDVFVEQIAYTAQGQRSLIVYGNGVVTRHAYDPDTARLLRLRTDRFEEIDAGTYRPGGTPLQDFAYDYDLAGNITKIADRVPGSGVPNTLLGLDALDRIFTYDPLYRLRTATGRECDLPAIPAPWDDTPRCQNPTLTRAYTEHYDYDSAGNLTRLRHQVKGGGFVREFAFAEDSNRLVSMSTGQLDFVYASDAAGNTVRENNERRFAWDHGNRMAAFRVQAGEEPSLNALYLYDAGGQRGKKIVRKQGGKIEITVYVDGIFEHHRLVQADAVLENNTLHVMDSRQRVALVRIGAPFPGDRMPAVQIHLGDHLASSHVVVDGEGTFINREEFTPYGETSFGSFVRKRYRFTGKERDEESSLNYHGARYYAPWLCRWISTDPAGTVDGLNLYRYVSNRPTGLTDPNGRQEADVSGVTPEGELVRSEGQLSSQYIPESRPPPEGEVTLPEVTITGFLDRSTASQAPSPADGAGGAGAGQFIAGGDAGAEGSATTLDAAYETEEEWQARRQAGTYTAGVAAAPAAIWVMSKVPAWVFLATAVASTTQIKSSDDVEGHFTTAGIATNAVGAPGSLTKKFSKSPTGNPTQLLDDISVQVKTVQDVHKHPAAKNGSTTAMVLGMDESGRLVYVVGSGQRDLIPKQRELAQRLGLVLSKDPLEHAELTALLQAQDQGLRPLAIVASRPLCPWCLEDIALEGGRYVQVDANTIIFEVVAP